ncbi:MAG: very short patch repair endonuclease [Verrucomicrobia bacterium]|nr:very short patch repair endonuclease [Verrucomicrobiota bacterium]MBI3869267.1 very short patch repair endonuclease [Verrucomicrobiota bacterium]
MADNLTSNERSRVMAAVRSRGNQSTELRLVSLLRAHGVRGWRRHPRLAEHPDFVFPRERLAILVDGCFWHGCPWHCRLPRTRALYWRRKIRRNKARDRIVSKALSKKGWRVLRVWEHSLRSSGPLLNRIQAALRASVRDRKRPSKP